MNIIFTGITFNDPNFPWEDNLNTSYRAQEVKNPPPGMEMYYGETKKNPDGVSIITALKIAPAYFEISLGMKKSARGSGNVVETVFMGQGPNLPAMNSLSAGGSATFEN